MAARNDPLVLSYHDSCLRQSDLNLLHGSQWLNDKLIGFAFEYFEKEQFSQRIHEVTFISPDVTQFIKLAEADEVGIFLEPLGLEEKQLVFLAVNDNVDEAAAGGNHWSLLLYRRSTSRFEHYDSLHASNAEAAHDLVRKVEPYLRSPTKSSYLEQPTPQQTNSCDCGVYVITICEHISRQAFAGEERTMGDVITPGYVTQRRTDLKELIVSLGR